MKKRNKVMRDSGARQREDERRPPMATGRPDAARITLFRFLLYLSPLVLCFSYYPLIKLGENETMYFELSLPLIWLVIFDMLGLFLVVAKYRGKLFKMILGSIWWWLFPLFVSFSAIWSLNPLRAILTVGVMWLLVFAVTFIYLMRDLLDGQFFKVFFRWFFGASLFVAAWCVIQCILDVNGVSQEVTLLCDGCTSRMFGFPHPNGFAIEPQFMGNLLLAPILVIAASFCKSSGRVTSEDNYNSTSRTRVARARRHGARALFLGRDLRRVLEALLLIVLFSALFLTMSRGAIYACVVAMLFLWGFVIFREKRGERKQAVKRVLASLGIMALSFVFALNLQGVFAAVSPTSDTYADGVAKVLNQLSLGVIDVRDAKVAENGSAPASEPREDKPVENSKKTEGKTDDVKNEPVENSEKAEASNEAVFDGYVAESTDTRVRLASAALTVWRKDFKTMMVGVGIGGAGQALYDNGLSPAPREIVQNEYASILLETGIVGFSLFVALVVLIVRVFMKNKNAGMLLALLVAYGVSLLFFSGLTNALQIVLLPGLLYHLERASKKIR